MASSSTWPPANSTRSTERAPRPKWSARGGLFGHNRPMVDSPTVLFVHSPLVGPLTWELTASELRREGHHAVVPVLTAVASGTPPYYRRFAEAAARDLAAAGVGGPVVLVGHSGAGALLPAIAEAVGDEVRGAVFVDALLPHPGLSWFDSVPAALHEQLSELVRGGTLPPWNEWFPDDVIRRLVPDPEIRQRFVAELPSVRRAYFDERAPDTSEWLTLRCAYVRLSEAYDHAATEAESRGWWVDRLAADHLATLTQPARVAEVVIRAMRAVS